MHEGADRDQLEPLVRKLLSDANDGAVAPGLDLFDGIEHSAAISAQLTEFRAALDPRLPRIEADLPEPLATGAVRTADGTLIVLRRHGNPEGPPLVVSHGNGLATDVYYPFWSLLAKRFDLVLYDFRNHGWSARTRGRCAPL